MKDEGTIEANEPGTGRKLVATWGFYEDEPTVALFVGEDNEPILLPRDFLIALIAGGLS